jgi:hypothetical protein
VGYQEAERDRVESCERLGASLVVSRQPTEPHRPAERSLDHPAPRQEHEPTLGIRQLEDLPPDPVLGRRGGRIVAGVALVHKADLDRLPGHFLNRFGQHSDLLSVLLVGRCYVQRPQMTERIDRNVDLRALAPLVPVGAGAAAALGGGLDRATVEDRGCWLGSTAVGETEHGTEVMNDCLEAPCSEPPAGLLINHLPRGKVLGEVAPRGAGTDEPTRSVEDVTEVVDALSVFGQQAKVGKYELPFRVGDVTGVGLVCSHALNYVANWTKVHNTLYALLGVDDVRPRLSDQGGWSSGPAPPSLLGWRQPGNPSESGQPSLLFHPDNHQFASTANSQCWNSVSSRVLSSP